MSAIDEDPEFDPEPHLSIIPSPPGFRVLHNVEGMLSVGHDIIGWRVQTHWDRGEHHSIVEPVTPFGVIGESAGTVNPDGTLTYRGRRFKNLKDAQLILNNE